MDPVDRRMLLAGAGLAGVGALAKLAEAGTLTPPAGPASPTMKTLDQIEPRIPVQSLPSSATGLYVISQPGSYYLTGNIQGVASSNGIEIGAGNVSLDLCGFSLVGLPSSGTGIKTTTNVSRLRIANGLVSDWGFRGVDVAASGGVFEGLYAENNQHGGLLLMGHSHISHCVARNNGDVNLQGGEHSLIDACAAYLTLNGGSGIVVQGGSSLLRGCFVHGVPVGIRLANGNDFVTQCNVVNCSQTGIEAHFDATLLNNAISAVDGVGIRVLNDRSRVESNTVSDTGTCISIAGSGCIVTANKARPRAGGTAYSIGAGNAYGPIVNVAGLGDISTVVGANHPWTNFQY